MIEEPINPLELLAERGILINVCNCGERPTIQIAVDDEYYTLTGICFTMFDINPETMQ